MGKQRPLINPPSSHSPLTLTAWGHRLRRAPRVQRPWWSPAWQPDKSGELSRRRPAKVKTIPEQVKNVQGCIGCPLRELFPDNNFVAPKLVEGSTRVCVAEAPGKDEAEQGEPLVGTSGSWLRGKETDGKRSGGLYKAAGVEESTVSRLNVINCRPPNNIFPSDPDARPYISKEDAETAIKQCLHNHVKPVLESRNWKRVDLLGEKSLRYLTGKEGGILRWRGSPLEIDTDKL